MTFTSTPQELASILLKSIPEGSESYDSASVSVAVLRAAAEALKRMYSTLELVEMQVKAGLLLVQQQPPEQPKEPQ